MVKTAKKKHRVVYKSKRLFGGADPDPEQKQNQEQEQSEDVYLTNKKLASIAKNVASKRELHSLILMLFLYVADNYVQLEDFSRGGGGGVYYGGEKTDPDGQYPDGQYPHNTKGKNNDNNKKNDVVEDKFYKFYKSELLSFMYKVARIVNEYHIFLNDVFQTTQFTTIKRRDYPLEQEMKDETAALVNRINLLNTLTQAPTESQKTNVVSTNDNTNPPPEPESNNTSPDSEPSSQPSVNEVQSPVSRWIDKQINEKISKAKTKEGKSLTCFNLTSTNTNISVHPYYPNPLNTDFVFCEIDELVRHAQIFTAMLQILHKIYTSSTNISDDKTIMALGKTYIGNSKFMQKYSSIMRGTKMVGDLAYRGVASTLRKASGAYNYFTGKKDDATNQATPATYGGNRRVMRTKRVIVGKRYYKGRPDPSFQIRGGGFFSSISNGASKAAMFMDKQTGVSKIGNRIKSMTAFTELSEAQKTKYELMLYLDKMYDLFKVNGFDRGEEILGNELGHLSPAAREFVDSKIQEELTSVKDKKIELDARISEYKTTVSASFRMKYALDESITQGNKIASFLRRVGNGQMQLKEKAKYLMGSTVKSMRSLAGFMNRNGLVGYAIGFLHIAANVLPFFTPVFPPAMALSFVASGAKYALIMLSAPVLEAPPVILKRKEDIMKAAEAMMRHDSILYTEDKKGKGADANYSGSIKGGNFLKEMLKYYDFLSDVKTKPEYQISFTYSDKSQTPNISEDIIKQAKQEVQGVLQIENELDEPSKEQVIKYYVSEYSAYYSISLVEALQTISIGGETSPFKRYLDKRALLNKMYIENEIAKYETLIKLYGEETKQPQNAEEIKNLKEKYELIRIPENMQFGSLKNLEQTNLRYGFSEEFIKNIFDNAGTIDVTNARPTREGWSLKEKTLEQLQTMAKKKNLNSTEVVKYNDKCNTITGLYVGQAQSFADKCRQQKLVEKRIKHMVNAAKAWHKKYDKKQINPSDTTTPSTQPPSNKI